MADVKNLTSVVVLSIALSGADASMAVAVMNASMADAWELEFAIKQISVLRAPPAQGTEIATMTACVTSKLNAARSHVWSMSNVLPIWNVALMAFAGNRATANQETNASTVKNAFSHTAIRSIVARM